MVPAGALIEDYRNRGQASVWFGRPHRIDKRCAGPRAWLTHRGKRRNLADSPNYKAVGWATVSDGLGPSQRFTSFKTEV